MGSIMDETTTIQIKKTTKKFLDSLKGAYHVKTYDEVVNKLVQKKKAFPFDKFADEGPPVSMKEILKELREDRDKE